MKNLLPSSFSCKTAAGFSLPEVTLALGIAAFGITTILGLLPQGLTNMRKAGDVAAASRISQHILGTLDQSPLPTDAASTRRYYFNANAVPVNPEGPRKDDIAYVAEVGMPLTDLTLPGAKGPVANTFLQRIVVRLKQTPAADFDFTKAAPGTFKLYSHVVAKTGL